tara:strand:- start:12087 stop:12545 length:459 start_codon:yes stop_codon:yes gene_type:complete
MKHLKHNEELILENKIMDIFSKFNPTKIKDQLKEKLGITEGDSKEEITQKLKDTLGDAYIESGVKSFKWIISGSLGVMLGAVINSILGIPSMGEDSLWLELAGMIFMWYRAFTHIDKYSFKTKSPWTGKKFTNSDYDRDQEKKIKTFESFSK